MSAPVARRDSPRSEIDPLVEAFLTICPTPDDLAQPDGYADAAHGLVDAVFSIRAHYSGTRAVVGRYAAWSVTTTRPLSDTNTLDEHGIAALHTRVHRLGPDQLAAQVFGNASKSAGRSKAELVREAAGNLVAVGVDGVGSVAATWHDDNYAPQKRAWTSVRGLGPVTFEYFRMNCGHETIKPDVMVQRWVARLLRATPPWHRTVSLMTGVAHRLADGWNRPVSVRSVDHTVWRHESGRP